AAYIKRLRPEIRIIGVEPEDADAMARSLCKGKRITLPRVGIFADGVAVKTVGKETFRLAQLYVDEIIRVNNDAICAAIKDVFEDTRSILEPAGALSIAGMKAAIAGDRLKGKTLVAVASGANMNFDRLRHIAERAELGEKREAVLAVTIPETPGSFKTFCGLLGARNITEFNYRYSDPKTARVFVGLSVPGAGEGARVVELLQRHGLEALDLTDNEMAKLHIRHLVGGRAPEAVNEVLYRFEFPERPGALMQFLESMSRGWNISLFHYRNHGADYGRILVGIQVPEKEKPGFQKFLDGLGYRYWDESRNPAYKLFLA
ncbi:MAG: threonine ammonia-lyase, biosynthetic, partial [Thiobacillus sp.]